MIRNRDLGALIRQNLKNNEHVYIYIFCRPLPKELISYAREDTHYLMYIYGILKNELLKQGNGKDNILKSVIQKSTEICKKVNKVIIILVFC